MHKFEEGIIQLLKNLLCFGSDDWSKCFRFTAHATLVDDALRETKSFLFLFFFKGSE